MRLRRPTSSSRPRRLWWSCLCSRECWVRSRMRRVSIAIWTSGEPVSPSWVAYSVMISFLTARSRGTQYLLDNFRCAVPWGRFTQALCIRGRLHGRIKATSGEGRPLIVVPTRTTVDPDSYDRQALGRTSYPSTRHVQVVDTIPRRATHEGARHRRRRVHRRQLRPAHPGDPPRLACLLYTSDAADDLTRVDLGGRR